VPEPMTGLRWTLGVLAGIAGALVLAVIVVGGGFRSSFGASDTNPLVSIAPMAGIGLVLASVVWPQSRGLMHAAAVVIVALLGLAVYLARREPATATCLGLYAAAWLWYYWRAVWRP
jgi:hypothetical protein